MKRKAPGNDQIYIDQFKYLGHRGKDLMLEIANKICEKGQIPDKWKEATMIPVLRKDKPAKDPSSYCPISLLPVGIKIVESMVLQKLNPYVEERKLIPLSQTGFRKGHSIMINLKRMYTHAYTRSTRAAHPESTVMVFFDAKKPLTVSGTRDSCTNKCQMDFQAESSDFFGHGSATDNLKSE